MPRSPETESVFTNLLAQTQAESVELSDAVLLGRIYDEDDKQAYKLLLDRYLKPLWRLAANILNDHSEAEDVIQEVFMGLWHKKLDWDAKGDAQFTTWLYRVVLNKCIDIKRKKSRQTVSIEIPQMTRDQRPHSEDILAKKQEIRSVKDALVLLPESQRRAMHLFYYEECKLEDIADHMRISVDAVKSLLKRARQNLKSDLVQA